MIVKGEAHLRRILKSYARYYNGVRTHRSLNKDAPVSRLVQRTGVICCSRAILADFITIIVGFKCSVHTGGFECRVGEDVSILTPHSPGRADF